jgi:hypothetical protein
VTDIDQPENQFTFQLNGPPGRFTLNPDSAVLSRVVDH